VTEVGDAGITVQLANGDTVVVATGEATAYHAQQPIDRTSIVPGDQVQVQVQVTGFGGGRGQGGPAASPGAGQAPGGGLTATDVTVLAP
jgi:hypothetical protein